MQFKIKYKRKLPGPVFHMDIRKSERGREVAAVIGVLHAVVVIVEEL